MKRNFFLLMIEILIFIYSNVYPCGFLHIYSLTMLPLSFRLTSFTFPILPIFLLFPISFINIFPHPITFLLSFYTFNILHSTSLYHLALFPLSYCSAFFPLPFLSRSTDSLCNVPSTVLYPLSNSSRFTIF